MNSSVSQRPAAPIIKPAPINKNGRIPSARAISNTANASPASMRPVAVKTERVRRIGVRPGAASGIEKESPAPCRTSSSPVFVARISSVREMVKRGGTGAAKRQAHQISVRNRTRYPLEKSSSPNVKPLGLGELRTRLLKIGADMSRSLNGRDTYLRRP